jgi:hypothetical protein
MDNKEKKKQTEPTPAAQPPDQPTDQQPTANAQQPKAEAAQAEEPIWENTKEPQPPANAEPVEPKGEPVYITWNVHRAAHNEKEGYDDLHLRAARSPSNQALDLVIENAADHGKIKTGDRIIMALVTT